MNYLYQGHCFDVQNLQICRQGSDKAVKCLALAFHAGAFLASVAGISAFVGFGTTLAAAKKSDPKYFSKGIHSSPELADAGAILALRALGWGTLYAVAGTSCLCYGIWKLSGARDLKDFRVKMGNMLPALPKNNPPQSRTEFTGLNDLMTYLAEDYGKKSVKDK